MNKYGEDRLSSVNIVKSTFLDSINVKQQIVNDESLCDSIHEAARMVSGSIHHGGKVLICGNGGSASDALHFCGEIVGRFQRERKAAPAIALNADVATLTAVANDYGYEDVFARGVEAFMKPEDILIGISTSGNSVNVLRAIRKAKEVGGKTLGLLGKTGGVIMREVDLPIVVPCDNTARIQESHICIIHIICDLLERTL